MVRQVCWDEMASVKKKRVEEEDLCMNPLSFLLYGMGKDDVFLWSVIKMLLTILGSANSLMNNSFSWLQLCRGPVGQRRRGSHKEIRRSQDQRFWFEDKYIWGLLAMRCRNRPQPWRGHLDCSTIQIIVTKLRLEEQNRLVPFLIWILGFITVIWCREHDQYDEGLLSHS